MGNYSNSNATFNIALLDLCRSHSVSFSSTSGEIKKVKTDIGYLYNLKRDVPLKLKYPLKLDTRLKTLKILS
jgi:hypothetical protein